MIRLAAALCLLSVLSAAPARAAPDACDNKPVYMVVAGLTLDRERMLAYGKAIMDSGVYTRLQAYYIAAARPVAVFEGEVPPNYVTLIVRFPCLAHARTFWRSKLYQETILPMRLNPPAGVYTVTVYAEADLPAYMKGKVKSNAYRKRQSPEAAAGIAQIAGR